jgi:hypothetical protein
VVQPHRVLHHRGLGRGPLHAPHRDTHRGRRSARSNSLPVITRP